MNKITLYSLVLSSILIFSIISCQEGLSPKKTTLIINTSSKLTGMIFYKGGKKNFPDSTECFGINVAAFKKYPSDSSGLFEEFLKGNVYINIEHIDYPADSSYFSFEFENLPLEFEYIVAAMQTEQDNINAQKAIGVYTITGDITKPSSLLIDSAQTYDIQIYVDFDNLPPQPF